MTEIWEAENEERKNDFRLQPFFFSCANSRISTQ